MSKAGRVHITPPTSTPISGATSRRNFLAAAGIAAGGTALALAAIPAAVSLQNDPVFAAIAAHRNIVRTCDLMLEAAGDDLHEAERLVRAEGARYRALAVLVVTVPTTHAGRLEFIRYADELNNLSGFHHLAGFRDDLMAAAARALRDGAAV